MVTGGTHPTSNHRVVHDRLVGLVLEVAVPATAELWAGPAVHLLELLLGGTDLDSSLDTVGGKRASAIDVPLIEDLLLYRGIAANEVVECFRIRSGPIRREGEVMVLKVEPHAFQIHDWLDTDCFEFLWITNATPLKDQWRAQCATADNDLFADFDDCAMVLIGREGLGRDDTNTDCTSVLDDHLVDLGVAHQVEILVHRSRAVNVCVGTCFNCIRL